MTEQDRIGRIRGYLKAAALGLISIAEADHLAGRLSDEFELDLTDSTNSASVESVAAKPAAMGFLGYRD